MKRFALFCLTVSMINVVWAGGATDPTEYANYMVDQTTSVQTAATYAQEMLQVKNELQMIKNQVTNSSGYSDVLWDNTQTQLQRLSQIVNQGQALSYAMQNVGDVFHRKYPGYVSAEDYNQSYQQWSQTTLDTLQGTLQSAGLQAQQFSTEEDTIDHLRQMAKTEKGRQQALEVGNEIAGESVNQLQDLRQLVINQTNAQNAYMAYKVQKDQAQSKAADDYIQKVSDQFPHYQNHRQFHDIPDFHN